MSFDLGSVAGISSALAAGYITERYAHDLLEELGFEDNIITSILSAGAGVVVAGAVGSLVNNLFNDWI